MRKYGEIIRARDYEPHSFRDRVLADCISSKAAEYIDEDPRLAASFFGGLFAYAVSGSFSADMSGRYFHQSVNTLVKRGEPEWACDFATIVISKVVLNDPDIANSENAGRVISFALDVLREPLEKWHEADPREAAIGIHSIQVHLDQAYKYYPDLELTNLVLGLPNNQVSQLAKLTASRALAQPT
jgi:hypothetical protein